MIARYQQQQHLQTLEERRLYLDARIKAKRSVGWDTLYDEREHAALTWAVLNLVEGVRAE